MEKWSFKNTAAQHLAEEILYYINKEIKENNFTKGSENVIPIFIKAYNYMALNLSTSCDIILDLYDNKQLALAMSNDDGFNCIIISDLYNKLRHNDNNKTTYFKYNLDNMAAYDVTLLTEEELLNFIKTNLVAIISECLLHPNVPELWVVYEKFIARKFFDI